MHRAPASIDDHTDPPLDLPRLAQVAHFSASHFHRLFAAWIGETLGDCPRRRRLEAAAMRMIAQPRLPVLTVAPWIQANTLHQQPRCGISHDDPASGRFACDIVIPVTPL